MSLFKSREFWGTSCGSGEEFGAGCFTVLSTSSCHLCITGSYAGVLRIYAPQPTKTDTGWSGFKPTDVYLEQTLSEPILQIETGLFFTGSEHNCIAILHPRKLAVYSLEVVVGAVDHGSFCKLFLCYEHKLQRTAACFCYGPFGGQANRDLICVQSVDCTLMAFEQDSFAFSRFLPNSLLPGPLAYVRRSDSMVTASSARELQSYKYKTLAVAKDAQSKEEAQSMKGKRVSPDWTFNLGEDVLDIQVSNDAASGLEHIFVLGERNLFCLCDTGLLKFMTRMECSPSAMLLTEIVSESVFRFIVATHSHQLLCFENVKLKWAASLDEIPVQLGLATISNVKGVVVTLSETGKLQCIYMGTDPSLFAVSATPESRALKPQDYDRIDREMARLQAIIRERSKSDKAAIVLPAESTEDLSMTVVSCGIDTASSASAAAAHQISVLQVDDEPVPTVTVKVALKTQRLVNNVSLRVCPPEGFKFTADRLSFSSVDKQSPQESTITLFMCDSSIVPPTQSVTLIAAYESLSGAPRVLQKSARLPLKACLKSVVPERSATYKITVDTNRDPVSLTALFPEFASELANSNALGLKFYGGPVVTILASTKSQRYRLQCERLDALWIPVRELVNRLENHFSSAGCLVTFSDPLPVGAYFDIVKQHLEARATEAELALKLEQKAAEFRAIQRRILTKMKDKAVSPLGHLDDLLENSYRGIIEMSELIDAAHTERVTLAACVGGATQLLTLLARLSLGLSEKEFGILTSALSAVTMETIDLGWEESVQAAITHLLQTTLSKGVKDHSLNPTKLTRPETTSQLETQVSGLLSKLAKGRKMVDPSADLDPKRTKPTNKLSPRFGGGPDSLGDMDHDLSGSLGDTDLPRGSQFSTQKKGNGSGALGSGQSSLYPSLSSPLSNDFRDSALSNPTKFKKKPLLQSNLDQQVPDLDNMEHGAGSDFASATKNADSSNSNGLINSNGELIMGL